MEFGDIYYSEPMYYWQPDANKGIEEDILDHPEKYSDYVGAFKKDGEWSRMIWDGKSVVIQSRSISKKTGEYARKEGHLPHLVDCFKKLPPYTILLGEICYDNLHLRSKDVGSILRCLQDKALEGQSKEEDKLLFYCFDILYYNGIDLTNTPFSERMTYLNNVKNILGNRYARYVELKDTLTIKQEYDDYLTKGGEGFVLYKKSSVYSPGKRTAWETIKMKKHTQEIELKVIGFLDPTKEYTGKELDTWEYFENGEPVTKAYFNHWKSGVLVDNNGVAVRVGSGTTDEDAEWLAGQEAQKALEEGTLYAKVRAMEIEPTGSMRHPTLVELRTDVVTK